MVSNMSCTKIVLHLLNLVDFCMGLAILCMGFYILFIYTHDFSDIFVWGPFFAVGGLLVFMVLSNTCGVVCPREAQKTCPNCCSVFSDFLAFIVLAAEIALAVLCLASEPLLDRQMEKWMAGCDSEHGARNCPDNGDGSWYDEQLNQNNTYMAIVSAVCVAFCPQLYSLYPLYLS